ncbi:MAG: aminotransferase class I/II-fold pyridoxal phosphate-dependent enzyme [Dethiobacteria bacterium]
MPEPIDNFNLDLPAELQDMVARSLQRVKKQWSKVDRLQFNNQRRVLKALQKQRISESDFLDSSGYGYADSGREKLEQAYADIFKGEAALVRPQIVSGTHALAVTLFGLLRPGELLLCLTGPPYDTLQAVIGSRGEESGTLAEWGIRHHYVALRDDDYPDLAALEPGLQPRVAYIQRSAGYDLQRSGLTTGEIALLVEEVHARYPEAWVVVDNCYGEFAEEREPLEVGADLIAGSLIKNPGGGLARSGGYVVGRRELVRRIAGRLTAPGLYDSLGSFTEKRSLFQGLFMAPSLVGNALKNALFAAALFEQMGYQVKPRCGEPRTDIVQAIILGRAEKLLRFCQAVQSASPVESYLTLEPGPLPGYEDPVVMAAGTFFQGATSEMTADGPLREPYAVFLQGGLTLPHALWATCAAAKALYEARV